MSNKLTDTQRIEAIQRIIATEEFPSDAVGKICEILAPTTMRGIMAEIRLLIAALDDMIAEEEEPTPTRGRIEFADGTGADLPDQS